MIEEELCALYATVGRAERCPGSDCPLWIVDSGRSRCALAGAEPELTGSPDLACYLVELRLALEHARMSEERLNARSLFARCLNEEQAAEA
jgi:hypothetical protein